MDPMDGSMDFMDGTKTSNSCSKYKLKETFHYCTSLAKNPTIRKKENKINHNPEAIKLKLQTPLEYPTSILAPTF